MAINSTIIIQKTETSKTNGKQLPSVVLLPPKGKFNADAAGALLAYVAELVRRRERGAGHAEHD